MKRLDKSELIFKIISYVLVTLFAISTLYPFIYTLSASLSGKTAFETGKVILFPVDFQMDALKDVLVGKKSKSFWFSYTNTLFYTIYGTLFSMIVSIFAAYVLSKTKLLFVKQLNFMLVFTMWFSAGMVPTYINYLRTGVNSRWGIIFGFGVVAFNIILLRNYFKGVPKEIEEAAVVDGATEFQVLTSIYVPMSKSAIATVTLFYALGRWNGYFWNRILVKSTDHPLQVFMRIYYETEMMSEEATNNIIYAPQSFMYAIIIVSIIPIMIVYPYLQKYFAQGVNVGGVKE